MKVQNDAAPSIPRDDSLRHVVECNPLSQPSAEGYLNDGEINLPGVIELPAGNIPRQATEDEIDAWATFRCNQLGVSKVRANTSARNPEALSLSTATAL
jgi:hypothetical protein